MTVSSKDAFGSSGKPPRVESMCMHFLDKELGPVVQQFRWFIGCVCWCYVCMWVIGCVRRYTVCMLVVGSVRRYTVCMLAIGSVRRYTVCMLAIDRKSVV